MQSPPPEWIEKIWTLAGYILSGGGWIVLGAKWLLERKKINAEAADITAGAEIKTLQLSDGMVKFWMQSADKATQEVLAMRRRLALVETFLREGSLIMKKGQVTPDEAAAFENRINELLAPDAPTVL